MKYKLHNIGVSESVSEFNFATLLETSETNYTIATLLLLLRKIKVNNLNKFVTIKEEYIILICHVVQQLIWQSKTLLCET